MSSQDQAYAPSQTRDQVHTLFAQTMGLVALTAGIFALGAYLGRNMSYQSGGSGSSPRSRACSECSSRSESRSSSRSSCCSRSACCRARNGADDRLLRVDEPAGGLAGRRRDGALHRRLRHRRLRDPARPVGARADLLLGAARADRVRDRHDLREHPERPADLRDPGLVIFAGFTMVDFQRLRKTKDIRAAPLLAASIFLDILNVFLCSLQIFGRRN